MEELDGISVSTFENISTKAPATHHNMTDEDRKKIREGKDDEDEMKLLFSNKTNRLVTEQQLHFISYFNLQLTLNFIVLDVLNTSIR